MANRRALLIGVPRYDDETFDDIRTIVRADLRVMRETLVQSQFDVSECGVGGSHGEATSNRINRDIKSACAEAPAGGVLLIYFSGHGVTIDDLLLLTRHLDGQPPAVTGTVDEAHLNIVARETGEPVAWLRGRLSLYAQLFELSHAEESSDAARPDH